MTKINTIHYEVSDETGKVLFSECHDKVGDKACELKLPRKVYTIKAPYIGTTKRVIGVPLSRELYVNDLLTVVEYCMQLGEKSLLLTERLKKEEFIVSRLKTYEISYSVIYQLYAHLVRTSVPIEKFKDVFLFLEKHGALWDHIPFPTVAANLEKDRKIFRDLVQKVFGSNKTSNILASISPDYSIDSKEKFPFGTYQKTMDYFLDLGANLNGVNPESPEFGTFLHRYLAHETPKAPDLIDLLESKRIPNKINTHFDYCHQDGEGKTPLIIAIATRNLPAIYKLLSLNKKGIDVGLNLADREGRTPLMLACAFGLPLVVQVMLSLKPNLDLQDVQQRTFMDYLSLNSDDLRKVLSMLVHPERGNQANHSYVLDMDGGLSPFCLYEDNEKLVSGDMQQSYFVVLSPLPKHQAQIQKLLEVLQKEEKNAHKNKDKPKVEKIQKSRAYILDQTKRMGTKTFLAECQEGQLEVKKYLDSNAGKLAVEEAKKNVVPKTSTTTKAKENLKMDV